MRNLLRILVIVGLFVLAVRPVKAVYAPIPEVEKGRLFTLYLSGGGYYDTNIFGAPADGISSMVYQLQPMLVANVSAAEQTFVSGAYQLSLDHFTDRPGDKTLLSHMLNLRVAHTFSPRMSVDVSNLFQIIKNPQSLMPGLSTIVNPDQSYTFDQFDAKFLYSLSARSGLKLKARVLDFAYNNDFLKYDLDHTEYIGGLEYVYSARAELQLSTEYRRKAIRYDFRGYFKNKDSDYLLVGGDYTASKYTALSARVGGEMLQRRGANNSLLPYAELGMKYDYRRSSYISGGYTFSVEEASNADLYTDMYVHHFFINVQHALSKNLFATSSVEWDPSQLNGRPGIAENIHEQNRKLGLALMYIGSDRWSISATLDYDNIHSEDPNRDLVRTRVGMSGRWTF